MNASVGTRLAQAKQLAQDHLQWVSLLIHQNEQQLLFDRLQRTGPSATCSPRTFPAGQGFGGRVIFLIAFSKAGNSNWNSLSAKPLMARNLRRSVFNRV